MTAGGPELPFIPIGDTYAFWEKRKVVRDDARLAAAGGELPPLPESRTHAPDRKPTSG